MQTFGYAALQIIPSLKGATKGIEDQLNGSLGSAGTRGGESFGSRMVGGLTKWTKRGVIAIGTVGAAVATMGVAGGIARVLAVEDAEAKLKGLGYTAQQAGDIIRGSVTPAVQGTIYSTGEAANIAVGALASGISAGQDLTDYLRLTADAATQAGMDFGSMGQIMNKVQGSGRIMGDTLSQLEKNGLYVAPMLADAFGVSQEEIRKMASAGKISAADFQRVLEDQIGGSALSAAETTRGAFANMVSNVNIAGQKLVEGSMPAARTLFVALTEALRVIQPHLEPVGDAIASVIVPAVDRFAEWLGTLTGRLAESDASLGDLMSGLSPFGTILAALAPIIEPVSDSLGVIAAVVGDTLVAILPVLGAAFADIGVALGGAIASILPTVATLFESMAGVVPALVPLLEALIPPLVSILTWAIDVVGWLGQNEAVMWAIVGALAAWKVASLAMSAYRAIMLGVTAATYGTAGATYAAGAAQKVYAALMAPQAIRGFIAALWGKVTAFAASTAAIAANSLGWVRNTAVMVANRVATLAQVAAMGAVRVATMAWTAVQWALNSALLANPITLVVVAIAALVAGIVWVATQTTFFQDLWETVWGGITHAAEAVAAWFTDTLVPWLSGAWDLILDGLDSLGQFFSDTWDSITSLAESAWNGFLDFIGAIPGAIVDYFLNWTLIGLFIKHWDSIRTGATKGWNSLTDFVKGIPGKIVAFFLNWTLLGNLVKSWDSIKDGATKGWNGLLDFVKAVPGRIRDFFLNFTLIGLMVKHWDSIRTGATNGWNKLLDLIRGMPVRIASGLGNLSGLLLNAGMDIIRGLIRGITNMFGSVQSTLTDLTSRLTSWKGPPEKDAVLLTGAGESIIQSLIDGFENMLPAARDSLQGLTNDLARTPMPTVTMPVDVEGGHPVGYIPPRARAPFVRDPLAAGGAGAGGRQVVQENHFDIHDAPDPHGTALEVARTLSRQGV